MNRFNLVFALIAILGLGFCDVVFAAEQSCSPEIKKNIKKALASVYPNYKVLEASDLTATDKTLWSNAYKDACPGVVSGIFSDLGPATALALIPLNKNVAHDIKLVIASNNPEKKGFRTVFSTPAVGNFPALRKGDPAPYEDREKHTKVLARNDVLLLEYLESKVMAIILDDDNVHVLTISN
jgi:hypothetical protein